MWACPNTEPDIYLEAARRLGLAPAECMVFEDAPYAGVTAHRAGFQLCGMAEPAYADGEAELRSVSDIFVERSFDELDGKAVRSGGRRLRFGQKHSFAEMQRKLLHYAG